MRGKARPMSDEVRYFIRNLGNHNEFKIKSLELENSFALGFYSEVEFAYFRVHFDELYELLRESSVLTETVFGENPLDKICFEFINRIYIGVEDDDEPYQIENIPGKNIRWMIFDPQEQLYLVAEAFFQLHAAYTEAWEFDDEEAYAKFYPNT